MEQFIRTTALLLFLLLATSLGQVDSADASKVDILYNHFSFQTIILVDCLWVLSFFLILVYTAEIKRHIVSKLWDYVSVGQILFLIGIIFIQASIFSTPVDQIFATEHVARFMMGWAKIIILFAIVIAGILFFVEWLAIFNITPTIVSSDNLPYLGVSIVLTILGTTIPIYWHPTIVFGPEVILFPIIALAAFMAVTIYFTSMGFLILRELPQLRRFKWMLGYSLLLSVFVVIVVVDFLAFYSQPESPIPQNVVFFVFAGISFLFAGYVLETKAVVIFAQQFIVKQKKEQSVSGARISDVLDKLAKKFLRTTKLESIVEASSIEGLDFNVKERSFELEGIDIDDEENQEKMSKLFLALWDLIIDSRPPDIMKDYDTVALRDEFQSEQSDAQDTLPPSIAGRILPPRTLLEGMLDESVNTFYRLFPESKEFGPQVSKCIKNAFGPENLRTLEKLERFDPETYLDRLDVKSDEELIARVSRDYLTFYRHICKNAKNTVDRKRAKELISQAMEDAAKNPVYVSSGLSDMVANALFATKNSWGDSVLDRELGLLNASFSVMTSFPADFFKEQFYASMIDSNIKHHRNAIWITSTKLSVVKHLLAESMDVEGYLDNNRLKLLILDPNLEESVEKGHNCYLVPPGFNKLAMQAKIVLDDLPPSGSVVVLELPITAMKAETTLLYKFIYHIKSMCEKYNAMLVLGVNPVILSEEDTGMFKNICEVTIEVEDDIMKLHRMDGPHVAVEVSEQSGMLVYRPKEKPDSTKSKNDEK